MGADRTPEERERMYALLWETDAPLCYGWQRLRDNVKSGLRTVYDRRLTAFPQLWDSLPPNPAEAARKEAEEDGNWVEMMRRDSHRRETHYILSAHMLNVVDRMTARAAAGYPVLIAPKGE